MMLWSLDQGIIFFADGDNKHPFFTVYRVSFLIKSRP